MRKVVTLLLVLTLVFGLTACGQKPPKIVSHPVNVTVTEGETARFSVLVKGKDVSYEWQYYSTSKNAWTAITSKDYVGKDASNLSVPATLKRDRLNYRCAVTNSEGTVYSNYATLMVVPK